MRKHKKPFVSVLISTYNNPQYLDIALRSYMHQSYKDFEIIVTDDGSDNTTALLVNDFKRKCPIEVSHVWQELVRFDVGASRGRYGFVNHLLLRPSPDVARAELHHGRCATCLRCICGGLSQNRG